MKRILISIADYFRETDKILLFLCAFASFYGSVLVLSASRSSFNVQFAAVFIGIAAAIFISLFDYQSISKWTLVYIIIVAALIIYTYYYGFAPGITDNKAWIKLPLGEMTFQPSELLKITFILTFAKHVSLLSGDNIKKFYHVCLLVIHGAIPVVLIETVQKDTGTALILAVIFIVMIYCSGIKLRYFAIAGGFFAAAAPVVWFFLFGDYQRERILILFDDAADPLGAKFQQLQAKIAIGSGGFSGHGLFNGPRIQSGRVPNAHNDFIIAVAGEELGIIGAGLIVLLIAAICIQVLRTGMKSRDKTGYIICAGVFAMFMAQAIVNLGMCLSLMPVIGVTLPFFSSGGTSLVCLFLGIGLVLSVYMHRNIRQDYLKN